MRQACIAPMSARGTLADSRVSRTAATVSLVLAVLLAPAVFVSIAQAQPGCGAVLTSDTTLTNDLFCPGGTALVIGADGITVDLNGHTITGDGVTLGTAGIRNFGHSDVTIMNGTVTGFFLGIDLALGANHNTVRGITADGNFLSGMFISNGSHDNSVIECAFVNNGSPAFPGNGISIGQSNGVLVTRSYAANNRTQGIFVGGGANTAASSNSRILGNTSENNVSNGIGIIGGSGHSVLNNISRNNGANGVSFSSNTVPGPVTNSTIIGNELSANLFNGISITNADANTILGNQVDGNGLSGISIRSGSDDNLVSGNQSSTNGTRGIFVTLGGGFGPPQNNRFQGNGVTANALVDVQDETTGDGTMGTDSIYRGVHCDTSSPAGICVP